MDFLKEFQRAGKNIQAESMFTGMPVLIQSFFAQTAG
jgi:hypothetical protein